MQTTNNFCNRCGGDFDETGVLMHDSKPTHCMSTDLYPCCAHDCEWCVFYKKNSFLLVEWQEEMKRYAAQYDELKQN